MGIINVFRFGLISLAVLLYLLGGIKAECAVTPKKTTIVYKVTSKMWDTEKNEAVKTSKQVLDDIHFAFDVWENASDGLLRFTFGGFGKEGYDGYNQIPYDGDIYLVLNGRYKGHGEMANGQYSGSIPGDYKKGAIFFNKRESVMHPNIIVHEIGHTLGLDHTASNASVMFSGKRSGGGTLIESLSEQDELYLKSLWNPDSKEIFYMSGTVETTHSHKMALVFAVDTRNGHTYSTRTDHMGKFKLLIGSQGYYKLAAKAVEDSDDVKALKYQTQFPQCASWYVEEGKSTTNPENAWPVFMSKARPYTNGAVLKMIDNPAPFKLTRAWSSKGQFGLGYLLPGEDVMLSLPEVPDFQSIDSFGTNPDYHFSSVPEKYKRKFQFNLHIDKNAPEGERLVIVHDTRGNSHIGLIGIHIKKKEKDVKRLKGNVLSAYFPFDQTVNDAGPFGMKGQIHGNEVRLVEGYRGEGLFIGGTDDWLDVPLPDQLILESGFTVEFWFKREKWDNPYKGGSGFQTLIAVTSDFSQEITAKGCPLVDPWALVASLSHRNMKHGETEISRAYTGGNTIKQGVWYHSAAVYNPFEASLSLYLNGNLVETAWATPYPGFNIRNLKFGTWYKSNQAFRGTIDEFRLYNYPFSADDIQTAFKGWN